MGVHVIDVSRHQGPINWRAVADSGVQGAWIKVGGTENGLGAYRDGRGAAYLDGARAAGLPYGTYYFAHPAWNDARAQAHHAVSLRHGEGAMWPVLDLEQNPHGLNADQLDQWVRDWCDEIHQLTGRESVFYGGNSLVGHSSNPPRCPIWIANYGQYDAPGTEPPVWTPRLPPAWKTWDAWQFNSVTRIPGITDNTVDQNVVTDTFWARMMGDAPAGDDDMPDMGDIREELTGQRERRTADVYAGWHSDDRHYRVLLVHDTRPGQGKWWAIDGIGKREISEAYAGFWKLSPVAISVGDQTGGWPIALVDTTDEGSTVALGAAATAIAAATTASIIAYFNEQGTPEIPAAQLDALVAAATRAATEAAASVVADEIAERMQD